MPGQSVVKYCSGSSIPPYTPKVGPPVPDFNLSNSQRWRRPNTFHNSLFGKMSAAHTGVEKDPIDKEHITSAGRFASLPNLSSYPTISFPEKGEVAGKLVWPPQSLQELLNVAAQKFGFSRTKF